MVDNRDESYLLCLGRGQGGGADTSSTGRNCALQMEQKSVEYMNGLLWKLTKTGQLVGYLCCSMSGKAKPYMLIPKHTLIGWSKVTWFWFGESLTGLVKEMPGRCQPKCRTYKVKSRYKVQQRCWCPLWMKSMCGGRE